ncbi:uncharacterized protein N7496_004880 [Penicillium cataractarum]|uniref:Uncharacterized protein n=1 Tax=Penicillium cataractarum TaxID=2100454 RepID=A0A9W9VFG4_9EURO|nr:uncharacterized protein N7496_004880 [Penicillium cataractarum]KAJ5377471.1 hypothetical protein N7496_004880 [Penicillium cataractarum]
MSSNNLSGIGSQFNGIETTGHPDVLDITPKRTSTKSSPPLSTTRNKSKNSPPWNAPLGAPKPKRSS